MSQAEISDPIWAVSSSSPGCSSSFSQSSSGKKHKQTFWLVHRTRRWKVFKLFFFSFNYHYTSVGSNLVRFEVRFGFLRFGRFKVRFLETYWRFVRFEVRLWGSANLSEPFWHELQSDLGIYVGRIFCKTVGVNFWTCFSLERMRHFSQNQIFQYCLKKLAKILLNGCRKSKFSKILKVRGSVLEGSVWFWKSKPRFGRFEVWFSSSSEVQGSEFLGSTQY